MRQLTNSINAATPWNNYQLEVNARFQRKVLPTAV